MSFELCAASEVVEENPYTLIEAAGDGNKRGPSSPRDEDGKRKKNDAVQNAIDSLQDLSLGYPEGSVGSEGSV